MLTLLLIAYLAVAGYLTSILLSGGVPLKYAAKEGFSWPVTLYKDLRRR